MIRELIRSLFYRFGTALFSHRTLKGIHLDLWRLRARLIHRQRDLLPASPKLHLGCGSRKVPGWLNVDVIDSEYDLDFAQGWLPWQTNTLDAVVSQHVIEHLDLHRELQPLFRELRRCCRPGAELYISCPDMEKACRSYFDNRGEEMLFSRKSRWPDFTLHGAPSVHMINDLFNRDGEHKNLFDLELLTWLLETSGFKNVTRIEEADLLDRFPEFPARHDDNVSLYVRAEG